MSRRVVITGIGVVSPIGLGHEEFWRSLCDGRSGIGPITRFDAKNYPSRIAGEVRNFEPEKYMNRHKLPFLSRSSQFSIAASRMALRDAGIEPGENEFSICVGSGLAGFDRLEEQAFIIAREGVDRVDPMAATAGSCASPAAALSIELRSHAEAMTLSTACSSGLNALAYAFRQIRSEAADVVLAGGVETPVLPTIVGMLGNGKVLSRQNELSGQACRPFDRRRDGYVIAEGAAFFILEELERAKRRGASVYAEIAGAGITGDAFSLLRLYEGGEHLAAAMKGALREARLNPEQVDYVCAHGSASLVGDLRETRAIKEVLGDRAGRAWVSSIKSMIGMPLGAGGALQVAAAALAIRQGVVPPTINYEEPDPECDLDYVPNIARERRIGVALVNSTGMGGSNVSLALRIPTALHKVAYDTPVPARPRGSTAVCAADPGAADL